MSDTKITCPVCPHACKLAEGQVGFCRARIRRGDKVIDQNYGRLTSLALDPIEKKPLANYKPGSYVVSVGSYGCNLRCPFCQNWEISQADEHQVPWKTVSPEQLVQITLNEQKVYTNTIGIAYTYNEPLIGWEYVRDCSKLAHQHNLDNILVSNGYATEAVIQEIAPVIDAANIDFKGSNQDFYKQCAGDIQTVEQTIKILAATPTCHLELTTLIIPGMNDTTANMEDIAQWIAALPVKGDPITLHITRFFPQWRMQDRPPTPKQTLYSLAEVARKYLDHVELGNI